MKIAVYAGTFDPITVGHVEIALRAARIFDRIIVAVAEDNDKQTLFTLEERRQMAAEALAGHDNIQAEAFSGLLVDYCREKGAVSLIRGLRAVSDFDKEFQAALMNRDLGNGLDTVFLMSDARYLFISSSIIKNVAAAGGDISHLVPPGVNAAMKAKFAGKGNK